jgi:CRP/FNR family transcriptional regulator, cyclic AMP receptor protein
MTKGNLISSMDEGVKKKLVSFFEKYKLVKFKKGQIIFRPEEKLHEVMFVKSGYARMYSLTKDGKEMTFPLMRPLFFASMVYAMTGMDNHCFFEAISPTEVWVAPTNELNDFLKKDKKTKEDLIRLVVNEFVDMTCNMQQLISSDASSKLARIIEIIATRFGENKNGGILVKFNTPHRLLASMTGLTRETITLQLLKMEKEGITENNNKRILVKDRKKLREMAGMGEII